MLDVKTSRVIWVVVSEEYMLMKEVISLEFLLLGEGILRLGLRSISQCLHSLRNHILRSRRLRHFCSNIFSGSLGLHFFCSIDINASGWHFFRNGEQ